MDMKNENRVTFLWRIAECKEISPEGRERLRGIAIDLELEEMWGGL